MVVVRVARRRWFAREEDTMTMTTHNDNYVDDRVECWPCFALVVMAMKRSWERYHRTHGVSPTGVSPFAKKLYRTYNEYFYFYFIPMWRVILTIIAVFLFTRWFWWYAILRVKPSACGILFFCTSSWWIRVVGQVVVCGVCRCTKQKLFRKLLRRRNQISGNITRPAQ